MCTTPYAEGFRVEYQGSALEIGKLSHRCHVTAYTRKWTHVLLLWMSVNMLEDKDLKLYI